MQKTSLQTSIDHFGQALQKNLSMTNFFLAQNPKISRYKLVSVISIILVGFFALTLVNGAVSSNHTIHMTGLISYPSPIPTPTPAPNPNNLAPLGIYPNGEWGFGPYASKSGLVTWQGQTAIKILDYGTTPDASSSGWGAYTGRFGSFDREIDSQMIPIKPGDVVVFKVWLWVPDSTIGDNGNIWRGATVEIDPYDGGSYTTAYYLPQGQTSGTVITYPDPTFQATVPWGTNQWVQLTLTWTVPQYVYSSPIGTGGAGSAHVPNGMIIVIGGLSSSPGTEGSPIYVRGTELYINPA
jgi:hypothetical protein